MSNYSNENGLMVSGGLDMTALSPRSQRRLMQYMDQEGEATMQDLIDIQRTAVVGNRMIAAQMSVAQMATTAVQMDPGEAERLEEIVARVHRNLCEILDRQGRW